MLISFLSGLLSALASLWTSAQQPLSDLFPRRGLYGVTTRQTILVSLSSSFSLSRGPFPTNRKRISLRIRAVCSSLCGPVGDRRGVCTRRVPCH